MISIFQLQYYECLSACLQSMDRTSTEYVNTIMGMDKQRTESLLQSGLAVLL